MAKESAEQKLLKLIENTDAQETPQAQEQQPPASEEALKVLDSVKGVNSASISVPFINNIMAVLQDPARLMKMISSMGIKQLNGLLVVTILCVGLFFVINFSKGMKLSGREVHFAIPESVVNVANNLFPTFKEVAEYVETVSRRNIFHPFERKVEEVVMEIPEEVQAVQRVSEKAKELKLVGVSWQETPESAEAMIENTITGVTYFKKAGETIQDVTVKNIYADGITIIYENQEMDMRL